MSWKIPSLLRNVARAVPRWTKQDKPLSYFHFDTVLALKLCLDVTRCEVRRFAFSNVDVALLHMSNTRTYSRDTTPCVSDAREKLVER